MKISRDALDGIDALRREGGVTERAAGPIAEASAGQRWTFRIEGYHPTRLICFPKKP
jgi:hypothetical protein